MSSAAVKVLFVCLGNICRSPTAHGIFQQRVNQAGLQAQIEVDSAGTEGWHCGKAPDLRAQQQAEARGYDLGGLRARQFRAEDFAEFDYVLGMDDSNVANMASLKPAHFGGELALFLSFGERRDYREVPDPYYGGEEGFELVLDLVEQAAEGLLDHIRGTHLGE